MLCRFFSSCGEWGHFLVVMHKLLTVVTPLVGEAQALGPVGFTSCSPWAQELQLLGSRAQAQELWYTGLVPL